MHAYLLPNGKKIDFEKVTEAMLAGHEYPKQLLDIKTGKLIGVADKHTFKDNLEKDASIRRYVLIPTLDDKTRNIAAKEFIDEIIASMDPDNEDLIRRALARGGWQAMEKALKKHTDGWIHGWSQFIYDEAGEHAYEMIMENLGVPVQEVFEGCGNCAICDLMRRGEDSDPKKLMAAFATEDNLQRVFKQENLPSDTPHIKPNTPAGKSKNEHVDLSGTVHVFNITLDDSKPEIWRRIIVPSDYSFFDLHCAIQNAMGWQDSHLHSFIFPKNHDQIKIEFPDPENDFEELGTDYLDERQEHIAEWFSEERKKCCYWYDFGDNWKHTIIFEKIMLPDPKQSYPQCIAGKNTCPPEDCGGLEGYSRLQKISKNTKEFDPTDFDPKQVNFSDSKKRLREYQKEFNTPPI